MTSSVKTIFVILTIPIIALSVALISLNKIDGATLYQFTNTLTGNKTDKLRRPLYVTKNFLPKASITFSDKKSYSITLYPEWKSLLTLSPKPYRITLNKLIEDNQTLSITQLEELVAQLKTRNIELFEITSPSHNIKLRTSKKSAQIDIETAQYVFNSKLYLQGTNITGGKANLSLGNYNLLDNITSKFMQTSLYTPKLALQFKFVNEKDKISIKKFASNKLGIIGHAIIPHDVNKMAQVVLELPKLNIEELETKTLSNNNYSPAIINSLLPNHSTYIHTKIGTLLTNQEEISDISFKLLSTTEEKQMAITGTFPSQESFSFKSNSDYATASTLYKTSGSHHDLRKLLPDTLRSTDPKDVPTPLHWNIEAMGTQNKMVISKLALQIEAADIQGQDTITLHNNLPIHDAKLRIANIVLNEKRKLPIFTPLAEYIQSLTSELSDEQYLQKYVILRNITSSGKLQVSYDNIELWHDNPGSGRLDIDFAPARVALTSIADKAQRDNISGSININAIALTPQITVNITNGTLDFTELPNAPDALFTLLSKHLAKAPIDLSGKIHLNKILFDNLTLQNISTDFSLSQNYLNLSETTMQFMQQDKFVAQTRANSSIRLGVPLKLSSSFALMNTNISKLTPLAELPLNSGTFNLTAKASLSADSREELLKNLIIEGEITAKNLEVENLDIDIVIKRINQLRYPAGNLYSDLGNVIGTGVTRFPSLTANIRYQNNLLHAENIKFTSKYSGGHANLAYAPNQNAISMKAALSFEVVQPPHLRGYDRIIRPVTFTFSGNQQKGYNTTVEAQELHETLRALHMQDMLN